MPTKPYKEHLRDQITDAEQAAGYLAECAKEDSKTFALAVQDVWELAQFQAAKTYQRRLYDECVTANWDPERKNTFAEEIAHLHEELSEAFRAWRRYKNSSIHMVNDKLEGVPIEFADVLIGLFYNAELLGFNLFSAVEQKHQFNLKRDYVEEGRQLHTK